MHFLLKLSEDIRNAIKEDRLLDFKEEFLKQFGGVEVVKYDLRMHKALDLLSK